MEDVRDVLPISALVGMTVLSRTTGNKLGEVKDLFIDPANGSMLGLEIGAGDDRAGRLPYEEIYSFGRDAIMSDSDASVISTDNAWPSMSLTARAHLIGTKIITETGQSAGSIANVFVTLQPPPFVVYEVRDSIFDKLLGREFFILASAGYAFSNDSERLIVPEETIETASSSMSELINRALSVRTFSPPGPNPRARPDDFDDTVVVVDEDETVVRLRDADETVMRRPADLLQHD